MKRLATSLLLISCLLWLNVPLLGQTKPQPRKPAPARQPATKQPGGRELGQPQSSQREETAPEAQETKPAALAAAPKAPRRKMVMVPDFDARGLPKWWGSWDIGSLFANVMISRLSRTNLYGVVERQRMLDLFREQDLMQDERFRQESITKIGKLLGADLVLFGYLTNFSRKKSGKVFYDEYTAQISFSARLVDISSGKVVSSAEIEYVSPKDRKVSFSGDKDFNPNDPDFLQSLFGRAINEAVGQAVDKLTGEGGGSVAAAGNPVGAGVGNNLTNRPPSAPAVEPAQPAGPLKGLIAAIDGDTIIINRGQAHGVKVGSFFSVTRVIREIKDPETGKVIRQQTEEVARIKITNVEATSCDGVVVSGAKAKLKERDAVVLVE